MKSDTAKLLWVKLPAEHAKKLKEDAESLGVSRADFMRLILINFIKSESTISISPNTK